MYKLALLLCLVAAANAGLLSAPIIKGQAPLVLTQPQHIQTVKTGAVALPIVKSQPQLILQQPQPAPIAIASKAVPLSLGSGLVKGGWGGLDAGIW